MLTSSIVLVTSMLLMRFCPYTKVEESFNLQAIHDICHHGLNLSQYDHNEFPGVVPRSFIGPIAVSIVACPIIRLKNLSGISAQLVARACLGLWMFTGFYHYSRSVRELFGHKVQLVFCLITASQFHFGFYMTRTLPNTFAFVLFLHGAACWLRCHTQNRSNVSRDFKRFLVLAGCSIIIFRTELALLFGLMWIGLAMRTLFRENFAIVSLAPLLKTSIVVVLTAGPCLILTTILIDSFFWGRWLWPEAEVAWFNVVLNKSSQWGTLPFWWYFMSVLPKMMLFSCIFIPIGFYQQPRMRPVLVVALSYMLIYSALPHKELRFVLYTSPLLNTVAAGGMISLLQKKTLSTTLSSVPAVCCAGTIALNILHCIIFLLISENNYPGGKAITYLTKSFAGLNPKASIYVDNEAAQSGVSRFLQVQASGWSFNKSEGLSMDEIVGSEFDYILLDAIKYNDSFSTRYELLRMEMSFAGFIKDFNRLAEKRGSPLVYRPTVAILSRLPYSGSEFTHTKRKT